MTEISRGTKPKKRGKLRLWVGKRYFIFKRYLKWIVERERFAKQISQEKLPTLIFEHKSLLLRQLKNVDMVLQHNKITNLSIAITAINSLVIEPGKVFSFWYLVGKPVIRKGYKTGLVLENGKIGRGIGGGLCQLGNLIYWMALHSGLTVTERWRHSYDVFPDQNRTLPFGSGATLSYNYVDLQLTNETDQAYQIQLWLSEKWLHGNIRSAYDPGLKYEVYESGHLMDRAWWGGFLRHNQIRRKTVDKISAELIRDELITENHAIMMYDPFLEEKAKSD
ncbi:MAG: VanW family protein [Bacteroidota bacterium]